jgi:hypothetical protein
MTMNRQFIRKRTREGVRLRWMAVISVIVLVVCGVIFLRSAIFSAYYHKITSWITERRTNLAKNTAHPKRVAANQAEDEPQIHFEFYTALPSMRMGDLNTVVNKETKPSTTKVEIADADELENELSAAAKEAR